MPDVLLAQPRRHLLLLVDLLEYEFLIRRLLGLKLGLDFNGPNICLPGLRQAIFDVLRLLAIKNIISLFNIIIFGLIVKYHLLHLHQLLLQGFDQLFILVTQGFLDINRVELVIFCLRNFQLAFIELHYRVQFSLLQFHKIFMLLNQIPYLPLIFFFDILFRDLLKLL